MPSFKRDPEAVGIAAFLLLSCLSTWLVAATLRIFEVNVSPDALGTRLLSTSLLYVVTMGWQPILAVSVVRRWIDPPDEVAFGFPPARTDLTMIGTGGALALIASATAVAGVAITLGVLPPSPLLEPVEPELSALTPSPLVALLVVAAFAATVVLVWIQTFGEEFAWRGYFLYRVTRRFGVKAGLLIQGALWGLWYAPVLFFTSYGQLDTLGAALQGGCLFVTCLLLGTILGWTRLHTKSVYPGAIANVTLTLCAGLPYLLSGWNVGLRSAIYEPVGWVVLFAVLTTLAISKAGRSLRAPDAPPSLAIPTLSLAPTDDAEPPSAPRSIH